MTKIMATGNRLQRLCVLVVSIILWSIVSSCGAGAEAERSIDVEDQGVLIQGSARLVNVETQILKLQSFTELINLTGVAAANQDVTLSAQESGVIRKISLEKGSLVQSGQELFRIDDQILQSQVAEAKAGADLAMETWVRRKRLFEEEGVGSELAYLEAKYMAEQADARLDILLARLENTVIRAPIGGILEERMIEIGSMVNVGRDVGRLVSLNPMKVVAGVPERYAMDVASGTSATAVFDVLGVRSEGTISYVGATVDPGSRTFQIELEMENPDGAIKPEMIANVSVVRNYFEDAIVIPQEALLRTENGYVVYLVDGSNGNTQAISRLVEVGPSQGNQVLIEHGLNAGNELIVMGQTLISNGDVVNIVGDR